MTDSYLVINYKELSSFQQVRTGLWKYLKEQIRPWRTPDSWKLPQQYPRNNVLNLADGALVNVARQIGIQFDGQGLIAPLPSLIRDAAHELFLAGVLRVSDDMSPQKYSLTYYGLQRLQADDETLSADPDGIAEAFLREFGQVDRANLLARYLGQASKCEKLGMELAGATMIGCAYELAVVQLADAVVGKWPDFRVGDLSRDHKKTLESYLEVRKAVANGERPPRAPGAATLFDAVHGALMEARKVTPPPLHAHEDWIRVTFPASFAYVREMRNDAGHPSGHRVELDDLRDHVSRFVRDYRRVRGIIDALT